MINMKMKYGDEEILVEIPLENYLGTIKGQNSIVQDDEGDVIRESLDNPINSDKLENIVKAGDKICIVVSDVTRLWQKMSTYMPFIVEKLKIAGIDDKDITFISSTGSHRAQSDEEHKLLIGEELHNKFKIIDHNSFDKNNIVKIGETTYGTPVEINKLAYESDHIIITGAVVYHDLAGFGGGRKSILPGISSYESIMSNHALALGEEDGSGSNPNIACGSIECNPIHLDMVEAAKMVKPSFLFNVIMSSDGKIVNAVSGDYIEAHNVGMEIVREIDSYEIKEKADLVIASLGGYPKDLNLYQATKGLSNAKEAIRDGGYVILLCRCEEGYGSNDLHEIVSDYEDNYDREMAIRDRFTVARYIGFDMAQSAVKYNIILVSEIEKLSLKKAGINVVNTLDDALDIVYSNLGKNIKTYLMPNSGSTLPVLK